MPPWRLLVDPPQSGQANMARDRQLYQDFQAGDLPILRFYPWEGPCLSLGRFQSLTPELEQQLLDLGLPWVKRPTGGQAILHQGDFTFSVIGAASAGMRQGVLDTYCEVAKAIVKSLSLLGIAARLETVQTAYRAQAHCFALTAPSDIHVQGIKCVGSAQVRSRKAFLQQSVIYLTKPLSTLEALFGPQAAENLIDLQTLAPEVNSDKLRWALQTGFAEQFAAEYILFQSGESRNSLYSQIQTIFSDFSFFFLILKHIAPVR